MRSGRWTDLRRFSVFSGSPAGSSVGAMGTVMTLSLARRDTGSRTAYVQHLTRNMTVEADVPQLVQISKYGCMFPQEQFTFKPHGTSAPLPPSPTLLTP